MSDLDLSRLNDRIAITLIYVDAYSVLVVGVIVLVLKFMGKKMT